MLWNLKIPSNLPQGSPKVTLTLLVNFFLQRTDNGIPASATGSAIVLVALALFGAASVVGRMTWRIGGFLFLYGLIFFLTMGLNARELGRTDNPALHGAIIALPVTAVVWLVYWRTKPRKGGVRPPRPLEPPLPF